MRYVFDKVSEKRMRFFKCSCGKSHRLTKEFFQTINPFNKNADGNVKQAAEIREELKAEIANWYATPLVCPNQKDHGELRPATLTEDKP